MRTNEDNAFDVYLYFCRLFKLARTDFAKSDILLHPEKEYEAQVALENIIRLAHQERNYAVHVNEWLERYITEKGWLRCLNALKQKRHRENKRHSPEGTVHVQISYTASYLLERLAKKAGVTKKAMFEQFIREEAKSR